MRPEDRIIVQMPLSRLWNESGDLPITEKRMLGREDVIRLLRQGPVRFVVANCGARLNWVNVDVVFRFWKEEVKPRLVEPNDAVNGFRLEDYPGEYCYLATEWDALGSSAVVLLEMYH